MRVGVERLDGGGIAGQRRHVDHRVEPTERLGRGADQASDLRRVGDVGGHGDRPAAERLDLGRDRLESRRRCGRPAPRGPRLGRRPGRTNDRCRRRRRRRARPTRRGRRPGGLPGRSPGPASGRVAVVGGAPEVVDHALEQAGEPGAIGRVPPGEGASDLAADHRAEPTLDRPPGRCAGVGHDPAVGRVVAPGDETESLELLQLPAGGRQGELQGLGQLADTEPGPCSVSWSSRRWPVAETATPVSACRRSCSRGLAGEPEQHGQRVVDSLLVSCRQPSSSERYSHGAIISLHDEST